MGCGESPVATRAEHRNKPPRKPLLPPNPAAAPRARRGALAFSRFAGCGGDLALGNVLHFAVSDAPLLDGIFHTTPIPLADFLLIGRVASAELCVEEVRRRHARRDA